MSSTNLMFGIEMEFLLRPRESMKERLSVYGFNDRVTPQSRDENAKEKNRTAFRKALAETLTVEGTYTDLVTSDYSTWSAVDEPSLDERPGYWRCELVSKILESNKNWQKEINDVFATVKTFCEILLTNGCSMHVHVSPFPQGRFNLEEVKRIMKAIIYYDNPLTAIMPAARKNNPWAESNVKMIRAWNSGYTAVPQKTWAPLFDSIDSARMKQALILGLGQDRYLSWNFANVNDECGTVEFRRPPGVQTSADAKHWISVTLGFAAYAIKLQNWDLVKRTKTYPSTNDLSNAIINGLRILPRESAGAMRQIVEDCSPAIVPSRDELVKINLLKRQKKPSPFAEKVRSRPNTSTGHQ